MEGRRRSDIQEDLSSYSGSDTDRLAVGTWKKNHLTQAFLRLLVTEELLISTGGGSGHAEFTTLIK